LKLPAELPADGPRVVIDNREQNPWDNFEPLQCVSGTLQVGDYSIVGLESQIAIERKSLQDLVSCCGADRERFQRELNALRGWPVSAIIVETTWRAIECGGWHGRLTPRQVQASLTSWLAQGHKIVLAHDRQMAGQIARDILFFAARYRWREARALVVNVTEAEVAEASA
jgi:ERCC4-type nuclease